MSDPAIQSASNFVAGFTGDPCPVSFTNPNVAGDTIVVTVWNRTSQVVSIVDTTNTPGGNNYTLVQTQGTTQIFALFNCASGANTITVTNIPQSDTVVTIIELAPSSGVRVSNGASGASTVPSVLLVGTVLNDVCAFICNANTVAQSAGTVGTNPAYIQANYFSDISTQDGYSSGGSVNFAATTSATWDAVALALLPYIPPPPPPRITADPSFFGVNF